MGFERDSVKLPAVRPDGKATRKHPLVWGLEEAEKMGLSNATWANKMGVTPQTLVIWKKKAERNRNFLLPSEQVPVLSKVLGIPPYYFRPDLWPNDTWRF